VHGVESKREERGISIAYRYKEGANYKLIYKKRERKLHADCQSRSPKLSTSAELSSPWGPARLEGVGVLCRGGQPPTSCPSQPASKTKEATGPNPLSTHGDL